MVLGTVEIGLDYGINNDSGKPTYQQAFRLLDEAWDDGIREIDTANDYGESEFIIGTYQRENNRHFLIDTKLPLDKDVDALRNGFADSCDKLNIDFVNILYLHRFEQCKNDSIIEFIEELKNKNKVSNIGVSIYTPEEMIYILDNRPQIDVIQFPFSMLDCHRWIDNGIIERASKEAKKLYVRSVYVQGLIFKTPTDDFVKSVNGEKYIEGIHVIAERLGVSVAELAYKYVQCTPGISEILVGCQSADEVNNNFLIQNNKLKLDEDVMDAIHKLTMDIPEKMIDPRMW